MTDNKLKRFQIIMNRRRNMNGRFRDIAPHHAKENLKAVAKRVAEENAKHKKENKHERV